MSERSRLGDLLVGAGVLETSKLAAALEEQKRCDRPLGMTLVRMGFIEEETLIRHLSSQLKLPMARLQGKRISDEVLDLVPLDVADKHRCFPLLVKGVGSEKRLYVAVEDPFDTDLIAFLEQSTKLPIQPVLVPPSEIEEAVHRHYDLQASVAPKISPPLGSMEPERAAAALKPLSPSDPSLAPANRSDDDSLGRAGSALAAPPAPAPDADAGRVGTVPVAAILRALSQLLVEKGIVTPDELAERIHSVSSGDDPS
jgi:type IV pilus assembly protein PilB